MWIPFFQLFAKTCQAHCMSWLIRVLIFQVPLPLAALALVSIFCCSQFLGTRIFNSSGTICLNQDGGNLVICKYFDVLDGSVRAIGPKWMFWEFFNDWLTWLVFAIRNAFVQSCPNNMIGMASKNSMDVFFHFLVFASGWIIFTSVVFHVFIFQLAYSFCSIIIDTFADCYYHSLPWIITKHLCLIYKFMEKVVSEYKNWSDIEYVYRNSFLPLCNNLYHFLLLCLYFAD